MALSSALNSSEAGAEARVRAVLGGRSLATRMIVVVGGSYLAITMVLLSAGFLVMQFGVNSWFGDVDQSLTEWFARNRFAAGDVVTANLSNLSDTFTVLGMAFGAGVVLLVLRLWRQATVVIVALTLEFLVFLSVGYLVGRPRPDVMALDAVPATASFPSGHEAAAIALYGSIAVVVRSLSVSERVNRWAVVIAVVIAVGVGLSRVYRGLHHPSDLVAGAVLGIAAVTAAALAARMYEEDPR